MKTVLITIEYPPFKGGVAAYYGNIVKHWPKPDEISVLHNNDNKLVKKTGVLRWLPAFRALAKELKKQKDRDGLPHVLVGHILPLGTAAWLMSRFYDFEYSLVVHGMDLHYSQKKPRKQRLSRKILKNAKHIICNSAYTYELAESITGSAEKLSVIEPGVEPEMNGRKEIEAVRKRHNLAGKPLVLSLGRLVKRKGVDTVLEAMNTVLERFPDCRYAIAGTGPDEAYLKTVYGELPRAVRDRVIWLGEVSEAEKWAWLRACDVFVLPAREARPGDVEGFGIVYLEASLAGKPVVAGRSGGVESAVIEDETGILADPESADDVADSIIELLGNYQYRSQLGQAGMRRALEEFNWTNQAKKIYGLLAAKL